MDLWPTMYHIVALPTESREVADVVSKLSPVPIFGSRHDVLTHLHLKPGKANCVLISRTAGRRRKILPGSSDMIAEQGSGETAGEVSEKWSSRLEGDK